MLTLDVDELLGEEWEKSLLTLMDTPVNVPADLPLCHGGLPRIYAQLWPCPFSVFTPAGGFLMLKRQREREIVFLEDENDDGDAGFVERHCGLLLVFEQIKFCVDAINSSVGE